MTTPPGWALALAVVLLGGCGDVCDDAFAKLEECGISNRQADGDETVCEGVAECNAGCINDAECEDILAPRPDQAYTQCLDDCQANGG